VATGAGGWVAVGGGALPAGFVVAVARGAVLPFALLDDGFWVAVGEGWSANEFAVTDASNCAALGGLELSGESWSSGAAGGGLSRPSANVPVWFDATGASCVEAPPSRRPMASKPPAIVSVPPATKTMAIVRELMMRLLVPHCCGFPGSHVLATNRVRMFGRQPLIPEWNVIGVSY
jgi:hypothetical protein